MRASPNKLLTLPPRLECQVRLGRAGALPRSWGCNDGCRLIGSWVSAGCLAILGALGMLGCGLVVGPSGDWPMEFRVLGESVPPPGTQDFSAWFRSPPTITVRSEGASVVVTGEYTFLCFNHGYDARGTFKGDVLVLDIRTRRGPICATAVVRVVYRATFLNVPNGSYRVEVLHEESQVYRGTVEVG